MPLGTEVDLDPGHIVLDRDIAPPPVKGAHHPSPLFSAHVCCGHVRPSQLLMSCYQYSFTAEATAIFICKEDEVSGKLGKPLQK